jgi:RNA polymerase sigma factor (sigma-70 family)
MDYQDNELIDNMNDKSEEARDVLYDKYKYIVDIIINKYKKSAYYLSIDMQELTQEALLGFSDALYSYDYNKESNLPTFISLCVERRVENYVKKHSTAKMKMLKDMISLDDKIAEDISLGDTVSDRVTPEDIIEDEEETKVLLQKIKELLSPTELEIYKLILHNFSYEDISGILNVSVKSIYDYVYRIRKKLKDLY